MDDERLKEPENLFGKDYFEEQLERIRDIRSSERRFYQKITDIYSQCSADYDINSPITKGFFATVYKGNIIKNLIMDCQSYTKYRPNETMGGIFVSWRRKEELPTGA